MGRMTVDLQFIIKLFKTKDKERILETAREKWLLIYKGASIRLTADCSLETMMASRQWEGIVSVLKDKKKSTKNYVSAKLSFKNQRDVKTFPAK